MDMFLKMALNNAWANGVLYRACFALSEAEVWADRPGFFGSIGRTLNHIYEVDLYYVDALEAGGAGRSVYDREDVRDLRELARLQADVDMRFANVCGGLTEASLQEKRQTVRTDCVVEERVDWLILHLVQHDVHHRGQVHTMLSHAGIDPPQLDDFYLEFGRVETAKAYWE